jgi:hypothetical protein
MVDWSSWTVAGVNEVGFGEGWHDTIPEYPSYRVLSPGGGTCRLLRPAPGRAVVQVRLFFHVERPPVPAIEGRVGKHTWIWRPEPGWVTLQHLLLPGRGVATIRLSVIADGEPWFEARVVDVRLFRPNDPRVRPGDLS